MNNNPRKNPAGPVTELNKYKIDRSNQDNNRNDKDFDAYLCGSENENELTIFGHAFTMSELQDISRFATRLELLATKALHAEQQIPDGVIFIMKVINKEIEISFGGLSKK
jgi:hypothetical protein